jgi:hypothetical protein
MLCRARLGKEGGRVVFGVTAALAGEGYVGRLANVGRLAAWRWALGCVGRLGAWLCWALGPAMAGEGWAVELAQWRLRLVVELV